MREVVKPLVATVTLANLNTEYSWTIPANCVGLSFQCRDATDILFAFATPGVVGGTYATLKSGTAYTLPDEVTLNNSQVPTLYFACGSAGKIVEIVYYVKA